MTNTQPYATLTATNGETIIVDTDDYDAVKNYHWYVKRSNGYTHVHTRITHSGRTQGRPRKDEYGTAQAKQTQIYIRSLIRAFHNKTTTHANGNPLDFRKANAVTRVYPRLQSTSSTPSYRGVYKQGTRYKAVATLNTKQLYLGRFDTPEQAAQAYDAKARELYGEQAILNFPEPTGQTNTPTT